MVMRGDLNLLRNLIQYRVIGSAMAELQFVGLAAERQTKKLVPQADAEYRNLTHQAADIAYLRFERLRITRAVGEKNPVGLQREYIRGRGQRGNYGCPAAHLGQAAKDILLDSEIVRHHVETRLGGLGN